MNALAHLPSALQMPSLTGQSNEDAMLETDTNEPHAGRVPQLDTLSAEDGVAEANLDDRLLHRDLKARIFGSDGRVTIGRYEVLRRIGRGGMGTVYVAHDPELDRKIALKVLRADRRSGRERMLQEARALARLAHPNVVAVHEVGLHDERVFVAMELVEGKTLRTWLESRPSRTAMYDVFLQAARGLSAAHRAGLVHRDFKPDNVLIGDDGRVRVVDFGVAKATDSLEPEARAAGEGASASSSGSMPELTATGQLLGTPAYMAPEQFLGASVDARTDVFAFSVVLYEALTGRRPFDGDDTASVSWSVLQGQPRPLDASDVPAGLVTLVEQGLSREADRRPASLDGFVTALQAAIAPARPRRAQSLRTVAAGFSAAAVAAGILVMGAEPADRDPVGPVAMGVVAGPTEGADDEAELDAFAAIAAATNDDARLAAAEAFLAGWGQRGSEARRAVAHAAIGDVQWRRSCPADAQGLCIVEQPIAASSERCSTPLRGRITRMERMAALAEPARGHLQAAISLAGVSLPQDEALRGAFSEAIARSRVQLADAELERYLTLELPAEIDFENAAALSTTAFKLFYQQLSSEGMRLALSYAEVKKPANPAWTLVAAARTGMVNETASVALSTAPVPPSLDTAQRGAYCDALDEFGSPAVAQARSAYSYCVEKAETHGLAAEPTAGFCRARLQLYPEPAAQ
jgi:predicted Ser/Thr protein kinase